MVLFTLHIYLYLCEENIEIEMEKRQQQLSQLKAYTDDIDKEVTLLLQNLQWAPKFIIEKNPMVVCKYDANHRLPLHNRDIHEEQCYLTKLGYGKDDALLPDPADPDANTLVKFTKDEIAEIFNYAAMVNPTFKRGVGCEGPEPLTAERLQRVYSADERRVIHDAVVNSAPFCHDLADLDLLSSNNGASTSEKKSRLEILAELRNMKRRRAKYRVAAKTRNYSDVLRDVIKTQMDSYGEATRTIIKTEYGPNMYVSQSVSNNHSEPTHSIVKREKVSPESHSYRRTSDHSRERHRSRDNRYTDDRRGFHKDNYSSKDRSHNYDESDQSGQSRDHSTNKSHGERHDRKEKGRKDNHSSKERSNRYDDRHRGSRDYYKDSTSRGKRYDDGRSTYHKDQITERSKTGHSTVIKQERVSQESDSYTTYSRDRYDDRSNSKDKGYRISKNDNNKYSNNERSENHNDHRNDNRERYNPDRAFSIKQERITPDGDHRNNREGSRKHHKERSRSKDKSYRESKTEYKKKHSHKERIRNHDDRSKDVHERFSPYTVENIKQERISPEYHENNGEGSRKRYREGSRSEVLNVDDKHKRKKDDHSRSHKNES